MAGSTMFLGIIDPENGQCILECASVPKTSIIFHASPKWITSRIVSVLLPLATRPPAFGA